MYTHYIIRPKDFDFGLLLFALHTVSRPRVPKTSVENNGIRTLRYLYRSSTPHRLNNFCFCHCLLLYRRIYSRSRIVVIPANAFFSPPLRDSRLDFDKPDKPIVFYL